MEDNNLYLIQFYHHMDLKKMIAGSSWSFNKCILLIHQWKEGENPTEINFIHTDVWVQFHGLPLGFASEMLARNIINLMGTYLEYDSTQRRNTWNNYMQVRVSINVEEPLMRKKIIRKQGGDPIVITFSYERFPLVCYLCGLIGHGETYCVKLLENPDEEVSREWPEEIQAEVRARNARRKVQWKRDLGMEFGGNFATQNQATQISLAAVHNPHKIGNNFAFFPKILPIKSNADYEFQLGRKYFTAGNSSSDKTPLNRLGQQENEYTIMDIEDNKKRPRQGDNGDSFGEMMTMSESDVPQLKYHVASFGLDQQTRREL
ncbi:hypothetical protein K2173_002087 [Erythroxylum novogranatense]|uniref:DUF4283 domain-containing protein n=1 Tax=Erythroxylum novogranatense TaxID=1862640 RepID=A0AAV8SQD8_9ROSI|nr:hypothetical protein K2173_002087 [Erythroxylum novogranatense]